jgi:hypothetical protein
MMITMAACLLAMFPMAWLGLSYVHAGQGLHPVLSGFGVIVLIGLGWQAACLFDKLD